MQIRLSPFEVSVIRRVDSAVIAELLKKTPSDSQQQEQGKPMEVSVTDAAGVSMLFSSLKTRAAAAFGGTDG